MSHKFILIFLMVADFLQQFLLIRPGSVEFLLHFPDFLRAFLVQHGAPQYFLIEILDNSNERLEKIEKIEKIEKFANFNEKSVHLAHPPRISR